MSGGPLLAYREVTAGYAAPLVGPASFELNEGDVLGLVGPNGAGKSTLLGALTGSSRVFSGEVFRRAGATFAVQRQLPVRARDVPLRGRELLELTGAPAAAAPPSVVPLLESRVDRLSGGQFQLIAVWACLGSAAQVVILDEPTNNMDPSAVDALIELLHASMAGRGVLVVTHDERFLARATTHLFRLGEPA